MARVPLTVSHPEMGELWSPKNKEQMSEVSAGSGLKPIWVCDKGHEWEAAIYSVAKNGRRCPYCAGRYPIPGETDLATLRPDLTAQWHPTKNGDLTPTQVTPKSNIKAWWVCPNNVVLNNLPRIWDAGKTRYTKIITNSKD